MSDEKLYPVIKRALESARNLLLTGGAGVGKTFQTREIIKFLESKGMRVARTASTGFASTHICGVTIHSFSGMGMYHKPEQKALAIRTIDNKKEYAIQQCDAVIIDEVSMLSSYQLDLIDSIFKWAMKCDLPFGGKQMIFVGDFFQLPPVVKEPELRKNGLYWAFYADSFRNANCICVDLKEVKRQNDIEFINVLNKTRMGQMDYETSKFLLNLERKPSDKCVQIYATNKEVDEANERYLESIDAPIDDFYGTVTFLNENQMSEKELKRRYASILNSVPAKKELYLKHGARVMARTNNEDEGYFNGSCGAFLYECVPIDVESGISDKYINLVSDLEDYFEEGVHFRLVNNNKNQFTGIVEISVKWIDQVKETLTKYYHKYNTLSSSPKLKVRLDNGNDVYIMRKKWEFSFDQQFDEYGKLIIDATFTQYPVTLAQAITAHKSQGCTLDNVYVDFSKFRQSGQGYVALSRARSVEGLYLNRFDTSAIRANEDVVAFYKRIENGLNC